MFGLTPFSRNNLSRNNDDNFNRMIDNFFNDSWMLPFRNYSETFKMDVKENENEYILDAELPGVKKEEIKLELNDGNLIIMVRREENVDESKDNYIHKERRLSSMQRSVYLPNVKNDGVTAKFEDGILKISISKAKQIENSNRIEIE